MKDPVKRVVERHRAIMKKRDMLKENLQQLKLDNKELKKVFLNSGMDSELVEYELLAIEKRSDKLDAEANMIDLEVAQLRELISLVDNGVENNG